MTTKKHSKHTKLAIPSGGKFHRNEIALLGAPCATIENLVDALVMTMGNEFRISWIDADHNASLSAKQKLYAHYIDKINFQQVDFNGISNGFNTRALFDGSEFVLVNGNHFKADQQIVFLNSKKKESLSRKLNRLTNVIAFVKDDEDIYDFLKINVENYQEIPVFDKDEVDKLCELIRGKIVKPQLKGLVLAGGKSLRMGQDKTAINYHGKPQSQHMAEILNSLCVETFISVARETEPSKESSFSELPDTFLGLGPYGGILSAFQKDPNSAWLVVASDQPLLSLANLEILRQQRDPQMIATCFHNPVTNFPEPLITIWEPRAYPVLLQFLSQGFSCPRKVLINTEIKEVSLDDSDFMRNVNTPEEYESMLKELKKQSRS